jgi:hypothetical protein
MSASNLFVTAEELRRSAAEQWVALDEGRRLMQLLRHTARQGHLFHVRTQDTSSFAGAVPTNVLCYLETLGFSVECVNKEAKWREMVICPEQMIISWRA